MEKDRNTCCEVLRDITLSKNLDGKFLEKTLVDVQFLITFPALIPRQMVSSEFNGISKRALLPNSYSQLTLTAFLCFYSLNEKSETLRVLVLLLHMRSRG